MAARFVIAAVVLALLGMQDAEAAKGKGKKGKKGKGGDKRELTMSQGTMQAGGQATIDIVAGRGDTAIGATIAPQGGYFVADQIELLAGASISTVGGATSWSLEAGGRYLIDLDDLWGYAGATVGYGEFLLFGLSADAVAFTVLPGVIYPVSKNVGIDLGTRIQVLSTDGGTLVTVPIGYLGVQAFFK